MESSAKQLNDLEKSKMAAMPFINFCIAMITGLEAITKDGLHATREDGERKYKQPNIAAMRKLFDDGMSASDAAKVYAAEYLEREPGDTPGDVTKATMLEDLSKASNVDLDFLATCAARAEYGPLFDVMFPLWLDRFMSSLQSKSPTVELTDDNYGMVSKDVMPLFLAKVSCEEAANQYIAIHPLPTAQFNPNEARHVH